MTNIVKANFAVGSRVYSQAFGFGIVRHKNIESGSYLVQFDGRNGLKNIPSNQFYKNNKPYKKTVELA